MQKNMLVAVYGQHSGIRRNFVKNLKKTLICSGLDAFFLQPVYFEEIDQIHGLYLKSDISLARDIFKSSVTIEIENQFYCSLGQSLEEGTNRIILVDNYIDSLKLWDIILQTVEYKKITELEDRYPKARINVFIDNDIYPLSINKQNKNQQEKLAENVRSYYKKNAWKKKWLIISNENQISDIVESIKMILLKKSKKEYEISQSVGAW